MTIQGLSRFIRRTKAFAPHLHRMFLTNKEVDILPRMEGKKALVDGACAFYGFKYSRKSTASRRSDSARDMAEQFASAHLRLQETMKFSDICVVWDGKERHPMKATKKKNNSRNTQFYAERKTRDPIFDEVDHYVQQMGIQTFTAPFDAELHASYCSLADSIKRRNVESVVVSNDYDCLATGAPLTLRNPFSAEMIMSGENKNWIHGVHVVDQKSVLDAMRMNQFQFQDFCILLGCDFLSKPTFMRNIGPKDIAALIREHGSIEKIIMNFVIPGRRVVPDSLNDYLKRVNIVRNLMHRDDLIRTFDNFNKSEY